jgi:hypothetical protein
MKVGYARLALVVPPGTRLGGYAARPGPSTGVLDELQAHVVTVGDAFAWVVLDMPFVHSGLAKAVAARVPGLASANVWVSATHTHAGPETLEGVPAIPAPPRGEDVRITLRRLRLAGVGGQRSGARPRRTVPVDLLSFEARDGRLVGLLAVVPIHPTVLPADNLLASADLVGSIRRALAARLDGAWIVVATGAAGDVSTRPHRREQTPGECDRLGALTADAVVRGLRSAPLITVDGPGVEVRSARLTLPAKPVASPDLVRRLAARLDRARAHGEPVAVRTAFTALQAAELAQSEPPPSAEPVCTVSTVRIGGLSLVALGAEPYLDLATQLGQRLNHPAVLVGYTNGYLGYLPVRAAYRRADYEVLRSPVAAGSAERVLQVATSLLGGSR